MIELQKSQIIGAPWATEPLTWSDEPSKETADGRQTAIVICPNGHGSLMTEYAIAADGAVTPEFVCQGLYRGFFVSGKLPVPCDFHNSIKLTDWVPAGEGSDA